MLHWATKRPGYFRAIGASAGCVPDLGAEFRFRLPLQRGPAAAVHAHTARNNFV